jgi:polar amino acid transport system permease protein
MSAMAEFIDAFLNLEIALAASPILWRGLGQTMLLALLTVPLGMAAGLVLALLSTRRNPWIRWPLIGFVDFFRAIPPLVLLIFLYAGLPFAGLDLGAWGAVALGFLLNTGAYYAEILRAGIESVPRGQAEAARALGLRGWQVWLFVVLPQAVRNVLPDLVSNTLEVVKLTSIASVVALPELLFQARQAQSVTFNATPIMVAAAAYFILLWPCVRLLSRLENRQLAGRR